MNRDRFFDKHNRLQIDQRELERKWRKYVEEQQEAAVARTVAMMSVPNASLVVSSPYTITLTFDNISNVTMVGDPYSVEDWNTFLNLPTNGTPLAGVNVNGNTIELWPLEADITIKSQAFYLNPNLLSISDTGAITQVNSQAFASCSALTSVNLPACTSAGNDAFYASSAITTVTMPQLTTAGDNCFRGLNSLTTLSCNSLATAGSYCFQLSNGNTGVITSISLPSLQTAGAYCFNSRKSVTNFNLPVLQTVGGGCFQSCSGITTISLPELLSLPFQTFSQCTSLTTVSLPKATTITKSGISSVLNFCVGGCPLTSFSMPLLTYIEGANTFQSAITSVPAAIQVEEWNFPNLTGITGGTGGTGLTASSDTFRFSLAKRFILPALQYIPNNTFRDSLYVGTTAVPREYDIRSCTHLGMTAGYNAVFARPGQGTAGNSIALGTGGTGANGYTILRIPSAFLTNNAGAPDGDIGLLNQSSPNSLARLSTPLIINP